MVAFGLLQVDRGVVEGRPSFEALSRWRGIMDRAEYSPAHKGHLNANLLHRASEPQKGDDVQEVPLAGGYSSDDVLQGRGKGVSKHRGNRRFRKVIKNCSLPYSRAQNNTARRQIVDRVLATVHDKGRFLEPSGDDTLWIELTDKKVREKISQALRYQFRTQSSSETDGHSVSSSVTDEELTHKTDNSSDTRSEQELAQANLLGAASDSSDDAKSLEALVNWKFNEQAVASQQLVSDEEVLASIGATHLVPSPP